MSVRVLLVTLIFVASMASEECLSLGSETTAKITKYLMQRIESGSVVQPFVVSSEIVPGTCYRRLRVQLDAPSHIATLYLSPDQRFLTSSLYDLSLDANVEVAKIAEEVNKRLLSEKSPTRGDSRSTIVLVEFGDFQCPYCRRFAEWYGSVPADLVSHTALVFKQLPLPQHSWAHNAALYTSCAAVQSQDAFWFLSDFLLSNQNEVTADNLKSRIMERVSKRSDISVPKMVDCVARGSNEILSRDEALATELGVRSTPTIFINGRRILALRDGSELRALLERELSSEAKVEVGQKQ